MEPPHNLHVLLRHRVCSISRGVGEASIAPVGGSLVPGWLPVKETVLRSALPGGRRLLAISKPGGIRALTSL
jgi:hypothetical protein